MIQKELFDLGSSPITTLLMQWYGEHKRELPWRETCDPYHIWISEVILQQTRIAQGIGYYHRFTKRFPDLQTLAAAREEEVLKVWQGLGYYSRARNLHQAAREMVTRHNGHLPETYAELLALKGVGQYTAAAVASIAFHQPYAVVDGNVYRILTRLFAIEQAIDTPAGKRMVAEIAQSLLPAGNPGEYNQAIMDFGALICTPSQPRCGDCVLRESCLAYGTGNVASFPVKERKSKIRNRYFHYFHILHGNHTYLQKRDASGIWKNLYEFPLIETGEAVDFLQLEKSDAFRQLFSALPGLHISHALTLRHQLTHQLIHTCFYRVTIPEDTLFNPPAHLLATSHEALHDYPVARLTHKYIETI
ncbi:MAG: A/G-specific adenine glycosylase [bacterium]|nr:A/G-specific adenine glycosylase [bacterium]MDD3967477.1 A/G-specific adenine glycosylase [Proteiniphilum sp.]MDD4458264.1 A/G-specific adenine glycosylase [Proteiniphilum sp.]